MAAPALRLRALPASTTTASCSTRAASRYVLVPVSVPRLASARTAVCSVARFEARAQGRRVVIANAHRPRAVANEGEAAAEGESARGCRVVHGRCFVVGDNIDTDQIIPAEYLTLVPSKPEEYEKLGSYAMIGLPAQWGKFIEEGKMKTEYKVIIGGDNFGCGSSRYYVVHSLVLF